MKAPALRRWAAGKARQATTRTSSEVWRRIPERLYSRSSISKQPAHRSLAMT